MNLKEEINTLFKDNTDYKNPAQATNQASSLTSLSTDLYTDSKRFVYELLQNADDSAESLKTVKVWIKTFGDCLVVAHTGKAFDARDLRGLCNVNNGTKKEDSNKTGYKGIGFKSVFGQSDKVTIFTNNEYFRFDSSYPFDWKWEGTKDSWEEKSDRKFIYPWQIIPIYTKAEDVSSPINQYVKTINANVATIIKLNNTEETVLAIQELSANVNMFLFLKNISEINFDLNTINKIEINRFERNRIVLKKNGCDTVKWLIKRIDLSVPETLKIALQDERNIPDKLSKSSTIELTLAAKIGDDGIIDLTSNEKLLYSYLPTDETKYSLPVLVNTSFLTNANREHLHEDSKWNHWIFKNIAIEIFKWISQLINSEIQFQAYKLIPKNILANELGKHFNDGIKEAIDTVAFVISKQGQLVKIKDSLIDFTFLSEKEFIGEETIKKFIDICENPEKTSSKVFIQNTGFGAFFKSLGATCFEWSALPKFLQSECFLDVHSIENNIELIKHFKYLSEKASVKELALDKLSELPFILNHKNTLSAPSQIYFPTADDINWNTLESELAFLHKELQSWLSLEPDMRAWIERLGVVEKTDISFIAKTIIPNAESYINEKNAIQAILDIFNLYKKGDLSTDLISKLSKLKLLTQKGNLLPAEDLFLSNIYSPRLEIEDVLDDDLYISEEYLTSNLDKDEWKRFFKLLGVKEGIEFLINENKTHTNDLIKSGLIKSYFEEDDKKFSPYLSTFISESYSNLVTLSYIKKTVGNYSFSKLFWIDVIKNISPLELNQPATAYWGRSGFAGQISGNQILNYIPWFIKNTKCIPVLTNECKTSTSVFLNTEEIKSLTGNYLPVFDGIDLSPDWKSFFAFKTSLQLSDYLRILSQMSFDTTEKEEVKKSNINKIQSIYKVLLDQCINWNELELQQVSSWADSGMLLNTKNKFTECSSQKYFLDGNNSIFQDQFYFLEINTENKNHANLEILLNAFQITILKQSDFELIYTNKEVGTGLITRLISIIPYFKIWVSDESKDEKTQESLSLLDNKINALEVYKTATLKIKYGDVGFTKNVNVHFDQSTLYVTTPWESNKVLFQLSEILCRHFKLVGHDKKLDFLLRSSEAEITEHFQEQSLEIPTGTSLIVNETEAISKSIQVSLVSKGIKSFREIESAVSNSNGSISPEFFHIPISDYERLKFAESLLSRAVLNITNHLKGLLEYDCSNCYEIAPSIIGGITKNGNDITIVARPSDNDAVLLYYTAEFDVLEYVDAEFWCEDGFNVPHKITLGKLLKITRINKIPITNLTFTDSEFEELRNKPKSVDHEFNAVPFAPHKIAQIVSSFANTEGGSLIFGINEITPTSNAISGLSTDFRVDEIIKKAITFLSPIPMVSYDWVSIGDQRLFVIKTDKSEDEIRLGNQKYIRIGSETILEEKNSIKKNKRLAVPNFKRTVAIIIGIENYAPKDKNQIPPVKYAEKDAILFKETLITRMNVEEENIYILLGEQALKNNLQYDLQGLFHGLTSEDRLIFYYVGHGFHNGITNYLSTYDMHLHHVVETAISLREMLLDPFSRSQCKTAMIFIDACAQIFQDENRRNTISNLDGGEIELLTNEHNYLASFFSCQPGESSYSCDDLKQGIWTRHLVGAIRGEVSEAIIENKYITDRSLSDYLGISVSKYTEDKLGYSQNPKSIIDSNSENVVVTIVNG